MNTMTFEIENPFSDIADDVFEEYMDWDNVESEIETSEMFDAVNSILVNSELAFA